MPDVLSQIAQSSDPAETAALIAEFAFEALPEHVALTARRCVILHWFDLAVVTALMPQDVQAASDAVYAQLAALPFMESLPWGLAYHDLTRQGLLRRYAARQPDTLVMAARLAAPVYAARTEAGQNAAEAFFCQIVAGEAQVALTLLDHALDTLAAQTDSASLVYLFQVQDEAEALPFVKPLACTSYHWMGRAAAHYFAHDPASALADLNKVIELDPNYAKSLSENPCRAKSNECTGEFEHRQIILDFLFPTDQ
jgi:hypothetical protein